MREEDDGDGDDDEEEVDEWWNSKRKSHTMRAMMRACVYRYVLYVYIVCAWVGVSVCVCSTISPFVPSNYRTEFYDLWNKIAQTTQNAQMNAIFNVMNDFVFFFRFVSFSRCFLLFIHFDLVYVQSGVGQFREFRVVLQEDPSSIFAPNVHIESTVGPIHYDVSRIYSGMLEGKRKKKRLSASA